VCARSSCSTDVLLDCATWVSATPQATPAFARRATVEVTVRPKTGLPSHKEKALEKILRQSVESFILTQLYPRTSLTVVVQVCRYACDAEAPTARRSHVPFYVADYAGCRFLVIMRYQWHHDGMHRRRYAAQDNVIADSNGRQWMVSALASEQGCP
jgi:hypothetical protein